MGQVESNDMMDQISSSKKQTIHLFPSGEVKESVKEPKHNRYENKIKLRKTTIWTLKSMPINKLKSKKSTENKAKCWNRMRISKNDSDHTSFSEENYLES